MNFPNRGTSFCQPVSETSFAHSSATLKSYTTLRLFDPGYDCRLFCRRPTRIPYAAKTVLDFFVHIWFGSVVIAVAALLRLAYVMSSHIDGGFAWTLLVISGCGAFSALLAAKSAQEAAGQWGELVKAAFDLYRGDLCKQLGFELPREIERERRMWAPICRTMIYRQARYAAEFTEFRPAADRKPDDA